VLPYDFSALADTLHVYDNEVKALLETRRTEAKERKAALDLHAYALTSDPKRPTVAPEAWQAPPFLNFAPLDNALASLDKAAAEYKKASQGARDKTLSEAGLKTLNEELALAERKLTSEQGLPRRPWMQHLIYAPGWYTGYGAKTLPGIREAIEERRYSDADAQIVLVAHAIESEAEYVEHLAGELESISSGSASQAAK
jgi:N-acetylated-alpha-linked acidic dipeptidase